MSRPIILSNGEMHVGLNDYGLVHDFYYPHVGSENHAAAHALRHKIGVWADGEFSWWDDGNWKFEFDYIEKSLIGTIKATNKQLGILIETLDTVDCEQSAFLRQLHIVNLKDTQRDVRVFMHQIFVISNSYASDTAQYLPDQEAIVHYKGLRTFIVSGRTKNEGTFDQFAIGLNNIEGHEGVYKDAEDGELSGNCVEHGRVDSVLRFTHTLPAHDSFHIEYWIAAGKSQREALRIHDRIIEDGLLHRILATHSDWIQWFKPADAVAKHLPAEFQNSFLKSIGLMKAHTDKRGAVIASTDTTMLNYSRDSYSYSWPRDAAYVMWPLLRIGYTHEIINFFSFCRRVMNPKGYLMHKYQSDGALGSSWHPYIRGDQTLPPIQEDETAIVVFLFAQYYRMHKDDKLLKDFYPTMIAPMTNFMASYIDDKTKLPLPSYDLWERLHETTTYTTAVVTAALFEAAELADALSYSEDAVRWREVADEIKQSSHQLYDQELKCFIKGLRYIEGSPEKDTTVDISSVYGASLFGLYEPQSAEVQQSYDTSIARLITSDKHIGLARFENDEYDRFDPTRVGNPWYLTTLWTAQHAIESNDSARAYDIIRWVQSQMLPTGVLAEQFDPDSLRFISVAPLAWSQAEFVSCLLDTLSLPSQKDAK